MPARRWRAYSLIGLAAVVGAAVAYQQWGEARDARRFPPPGEFVAVAGGRLHILCIGSGTPTVFFISGSGTPSVTLYEAQRRSARISRTCTYDRAGLGWSKRQRAPITITQMIDHFGAVVERFAPGEYIVLVPESFGGLIALGYFERHPARVAGAVFDDASEPALWLAEAPKTLDESKRKDLLWQMGWRSGFVRLFYPLGEPDWAKRLPVETRAQLRAIFSRPIPSFSRDWTDAVEHMKPVDVGTVVAGSWGQRPIIVLRHGLRSASLSSAFEDGWPAAQARLAALSSDSGGVIANKNGHAIAEENPQLVADAVKTVVMKVRMRSRGDMERASMP